MFEANRTRSLLVMKYPCGNEKCRGRFMQALSDRVNTCRDRQVRSRVENPTAKAASAGSQPAHPVATSVRSVRRALPVMRLGDHRRLAVAIIAVGLAIAAANRAE